MSPKERKRVREREKLATKNQLQLGKAVVSGETLPLLHHFVVEGAPSAGTAATSTSAEIQLQL